MRKQYLLIAAIFISVLSACAYLFATPVYSTKQTKKPQCSATCESKSNPQTGFFIFDSFSGNL